MQYLIFILIICILLALLLKKKSTPGVEKKKEPVEKDSVDYTTGYQSKWLFSYNEKKAYNTIQKVAAERGYTALAKVRLFDLVEPKAELKKDKAYQWKIQAKHVDFVVCDEKLVAHWVIELLDSSHKTEDRKERDRFVSDVLINCGYKVLEAYEMDENGLREFLE